MGNVRERYTFLERRYGYGLPNGYYVFKRDSDGQEWCTTLRWFWGQCSYFSCLPGCESWGCEAFALAQPGSTSGRGGAA